jgi:hypothetical protein
LSEYKGADEEIQQDKDSAWRERFSTHGAMSEKNNSAPDVLKKLLELSILK